MTAMLDRSTNPEFRISPKRLAKELVKGQRIDPQRVSYSDEELANMQSKTNPVEEARSRSSRLRRPWRVQTRWNKSVEGMFSATSAANQIALQPSIAPMAVTCCSLPDSSMPTRRQPSQAFPWRRGEFRCSTTRRQFPAQSLGRHGRRNRDRSAPRWRGGTGLIAVTRCDRNSATLHHCPGRSPDGSVAKVPVRSGR